MARHIPRHKSWKLELTSDYVGLSEEDEKYLRAFNSVEIFNEFKADDQKILGINLTKDEKKEYWHNDHMARRCCLNVSAEEVAREHRRTSKKPTTKSRNTAQRHMEFLDSKKLVVDNFDDDDINDY